MIEITPITSEIFNPRPIDGYMNATAMSKAADRDLQDFLDLPETKEYLEVLAKHTQLPLSELIRVEEETWVHPNLGIYLGQGLSPKLAAQIAHLLFNTEEA